MEPWLRARAARAVAALADDDAEGVVPDVVPAQRGGEAGAAAHAERVPDPDAGGAMGRAGLGLGLSPFGGGGGGGGGSEDDDLMPPLAAVVRAAAVVAEGGGAGHAEAVLPAGRGEVLRDEPPGPRADGLRS